METQTCEFGFRVAPDAGPHPGVLMIHDVWGLKDHTRQYSVASESRPGLRGRVDELARRTPRGWGREPRASLGSSVVVCRVVPHRTRPGVVLPQLQDRRCFKNAVFIAP